MVLTSGGRKMGNNNTLQYVFPSLVTDTCYGRVESGLVLLVQVIKCDEFVGAYRESCIVFPNSAINDTCFMFGFFITKVAFTVFLNA